MLGFGRRRLYHSLFVFFCVAIAAQSFSLRGQIELVRRKVIGVMS